MEWRHAARARYAEACRYRRRDYRAADANRTRQPGEVKGGEMIRAKSARPSASFQQNNFNHIPLFTSCFYKAVISSQRLFLRYYEQSFFSISTYNNLELLPFK